MNNHANPIDALIEVLCQIVALKERSSRDMLLRDLPSNPVSSMIRHDSPRQDITHIVDQASSWGRIESKNELALIIVIDQARKLVKGTAQERQLKEIRQDILNTPDLSDIDTIRKEYTDSPSDSNVQPENTPSLLEETPKKESTTPEFTSSDSNVDLLSKSHKILLKWSKYLQRKPTPELGSNPDLINSIHEEIKQVTEDIRQHLGPKFDLDRVPLSKANLYFEATRCLDTTREHLEQVKQKGRGSKDNTHKCLGNIEKSLASLASLKNSLLPSHPPTKGSESDLVVPPYTAPLPISRYWVIIVGVGTHENKPVYGILPHAANDAYELAKVLLSGARGYKEERLSLFVNASESSHQDSNIQIRGRPVFTSVIKAINNLANPERLKEDDLLMFYFSGHGVLDDERPYLVCEDTDPGSLKETALDMLTIIEKIENSGAGVKVIILDSCHAGASLGIKSVEPMKEDFIKRVFEKARGISIMTSCKAKEFSYPNNDKSMSVFTEKLVETLCKAQKSEQRYLTVSKLYENVKSLVTKWVEDNRSDKIQTPQIHIKGDSYAIIIDWNPELPSTSD